MHLWHCSYINNIFEKVHGGLKEKLAENWRKLDFNEAKGGKEKKPRVKTIEKKI